MFKSIFAAIAIFIASIFGGHQVAAPSQPAAAVVAVVSGGAPSASATGTAGSQSSPTAGTTTIVNQYITQPVIEHTIQTNTSQSLSQLQAEIAGLQVQISQLLNAQHPSYLSGAPAVQTFLGNTIPPLFSTLRAADIPIDITASNYLALTGGTLSGNLTLTGNLTVSGAQTLSGAITIPYLTATSTTLVSSFQQLLVNASTTLQNFTGLNATTTNIFSTNASSTNLHTSNLFIGSLSGFLKATAGAVAAALVNLASDVTGILGVANGGTGWSSLAAGSIPFGNGASALATSSSLYWDNINGRLGVGTASPAQKLDVAGNINISAGSAYMYNGANVITASTTLGNYFFGDRGNLATTGTYNSSLGTGALHSLTTGNYNTALGASSLYTITTSSYNTAVGFGGLANTTSGSENTAVGYQSLYRNTSGTQNSAFGSYALNVNTTGSYNTAVGRAVLIANTTGSQNTAVGYGILGANTTGASNVAVGSAALNANTTGSYNIAVGVNALYANTTGSYSTAIGVGTLQNNTGGVDNVALGENALNANTTGSDSTGLGYLALQSSTGSENTAVGSTALNSNTTGSQNTAVGRTALALNTTGTDNTATGAFALGHNTTGSEDTAFGRASSWYNTTGDFNASVGWRTLYSNSTGSSDTALGEYALHFLETGSYDTGIGAATGFFTVPAPSATVVAGSGLGIGDYTYHVSFVLDGVETTPGNFITITTTSGNQQVNLSSIPTYSGPKTITARKIYRDPVNGENLYYLLATINDNTTTTYVDNTPDSSLGAQSSDPSSSIMLGYGATAFNPNEMVIGSSGYYISNLYLGEGVYGLSIPLIL
jgi:hypothetical protein